MSVKVLPQTRVLASAVPPCTQTFFDFACPGTATHSTDSPPRSVTVHRKRAMSQGRVGSATASISPEQSRNNLSEDHPGQQNQLSTSTDGRPGLAKSPHANRKARGAPMLESPMLEYPVRESTLEARPVETRKRATARTASTPMDPTSAQPRRRVTVLPPLPVAGRLAVPAAAAPAAAAGVVLVQERNDGAPDEVASSAHGPQMRARIGLLFELIGVGLMMALLMALAALS